MDLKIFGDLKVAVYRDRFSKLTKVEPGVLDGWVKEGCVQWPMS